MMTNISPVEYIPDATCPRWEKFLEEIFQENKQIIAYIHRAIGYTLTGDTRERVIFLLYGSEGHNGKTTMINIIARLCGTYAHCAPFQEFLQKFHDGATNELALFQGKRFIHSVEPPKGKAFNEALLKQLSGQDLMRTRPLYRESTEWKPQFKLFFAANYKPQIHETVGAIWDRVQLIPFLASFKGDKRDDQLAQKLEEELPGIFAWAVRGCLEWQKVGLNPPEEVKAATSGYRAEMNNVTDFINDCCVQDDEARVLASGLYGRYKNWATAGGIRFPMSKKSLAQELERMGFKPWRTGGRAYYRGLELASFKLDDVDTEGF